MSKQVTLTLSNELYEQAQRWASITQQNLQEALADALAIALKPMYDTPNEKPVEELSNQEVIALCEVKMNHTQGQRLSHLIGKQREGMLNDEEHRELQALFQIYNHLWVRQSKALAEAVKRGLREPLPPILMSSHF